MKKVSAVIFIISCFIVSCDGGLSPDATTVEPGFSGTITFKGDWPEGITRTHIVLFKDSLLSSSDFNAQNLKYVSEEIPFGVNEYEYNSKINSVIENIVPGEYAYLAVVQSRSIFLSLSRATWNVVGVYTGDDSSGILRIPSDSFVENVNIECDFDNPPPQPPGGENFP